MVKLVVGLGNPGERYRLTKHNVGWWVIDALSERFGANFWADSKFKGELSSIQIDGRKVFFLKPTTYMNLSGESVSSVCRYFKIEPEEILVILDDMDLPIGKIRLRLKGGSGGHRGLMSIEQHLGTSDFPRLRIGIGRPESKEKVVDYVLSPFKGDELEEIKRSVERAVNCVERILKSGCIDQKTLSYCNQGG